MKGTIAGGTMTVTLNINYERLAAPGHEKHWLPCSDCGEMQVEDRLVVATICEQCQTCSYCGKKFPLSELVRCGHRVCCGNCLPCEECAEPGPDAVPLPTGHQPGCFCVLCQAAERAQERTQRQAEGYDDDVLHLDRWGCVVWIEGEALLCCEANTYAESGKADACELTAPDSQEILDAINAHFGTNYRYEDFAGR